MDRIVSFLLFAAFFYLMMRFGCGAHAVHGHHHGHAGHSGAGDAKDPVCGMEVGADSRYAEVYQQHEYRFCSRKCLDKFDAEPQRFSRQERAST